jgi:hypothetical protein
LLGFASIRGIAVSQLPSQHTLRDGVSALIEAAMRGEGVIISDEPHDSVVGPQNDGLVALTLEGPRPWAEIAIDSGNLDLDDYGRLLYDSGKITLLQHQGARPRYYQLLRPRRYRQLRQASPGGSGIQKVHAIVGGFHLGPAPKDYLTQVVSEIKTLEPDVVIPMHCSGLNFLQEATAQLGSRVLVTTTGGRITFGA